MIYDNYGLKNANVGASRESSADNHDDGESEREHEGDGGDDDDV